MTFDIVEIYYGTLVIVLLGSLAWLDRDERKRRAARGGHEAGQPPRGG